MEIIALLLSIVSLGIAFLAYTEARKAGTAITESMYSSFNNFVLTEIDAVGPLTPYRKDSNEDKQWLRMRIYYLALFNRWKEDIGTQRQESHMTFRKEVFGNDLTEFRTKVLRRGYEEHEADMSAAVLKEIHSDEPYYRDSFWEVYFPGFWPCSVPKADGYSESHHKAS